MADTQIVDEVNRELERLQLLPLNSEQIECLQDPSRLEESAQMLCDLRDRCGVRLPLPSGQGIVGPFAEQEDAEFAAAKHATEYLVVTVDEMATDDSRSTGIGNEFYVTGYVQAHAAVVLAAIDDWVAVWVRGGRYTAPDAEV